MVIIFGSKPLILSSPFDIAATTQKVPHSILSAITEWDILFNFFTPSISTDLFPIHFIFAPALFKKFVRSILISGSIAQFFKIVFPLASVAASIAFSVAPTEILGNLIIDPFKPLCAFA